MKTEYKKTKLGLIPEDWEVVKLGDVCSKIGDGLHSTPKYVGESDYFFINGTNLVKGKITIDDRTKCISEAEFLKHKINLNFPTILMSINGTIGNLAVFRNEKIVLGKSAAFISTQEENLHYKYLYNYLQTSAIKNSFNRSLTGSTIKNLSLKAIRTTFIPLPPLPEQVRIADCLSRWDRGIALLERLIAQKEEQKKGLMQQLLTGRQRLPGFAGEWESVKLGDVTKRVKRKNTELNDNVITISAQRGFVRQEDFFSKRVASSTLSNYYLLHKGEFAYNKSYSKGYPMGAFKRLDDFDKAVVTTLYICFKCKEHVDSDFMQQFFEGGMMIKGLMRIAQEGGRAHGLLNISLTDFFDLPLSLPPLPEQKAIAQILNTADRELSLLGAKLGQYRLQKRGIMQQLLTGRKRLV